MLALLCIGTLIIFTLYWLTLAICKKTVNIIKKASTKTSPIIDHTINNK